MEMLDRCAGPRTFTAETARWQYFVLGWFNNVDSSSNRLLFPPRSGKHKVAAHSFPS